MKALDILKNGIVFMKDHIDANPNSKEHIELEIAIYEEAIAELDSIDAHIKVLQNLYHHAEDDKAHLTQKINGLELKLEEREYWIRGLESRLESKDQA